ncbi:hypothetical protein D3C72_1622140 [compost metagenome]
MAGDATSVQQTSLAQHQHARATGARTSTALVELPGEPCQLLRIDHRQATQGDAICVARVQSAGLVSVDVEHAVQAEAGNHQHTRVTVADARQRIRAQGHAVAQAQMAAAADDPPTQCRSAQPLGRAVGEVKHVQGRADAGCKGAVEDGDDEFGRVHSGFFFVNQDTSQSRPRPF